MLRLLPFLYLILHQFAWGYIFLGGVVISLGACQLKDVNRAIKAKGPEAPISGSPSTQRRPIITDTPIIKSKNRPVNLPKKKGLISGSSSPSKTSPPVSLPIPDLPSLAHLLDQKSKNITDTNGVQRPLVPPPVSDDTVRAAILLPLSGPNSDLGHAMLNAAKLAFFDFADRRLELLPLDTEGTSEGAQKAAITAIGDRAHIILGPLLSTSVRAVAPPARAAGISVIAFSSDRSVVGSGVYTMGFVPADQVRRVVTYAFQKSLTRFAVLAPDNNYGHTVVRALERTVSAVGADLVDAKFYNPVANDFTDVVRVLARYDSRRQALLKQRSELEAKDDNLSKSALKRLEALQTIGDLPFDALLVADGGERLQSLAALLPFFDIDPLKVRILGTGQWDVPGIGAEPALLGGWYAAPMPSARAEFAAIYKETFGDTPPRLATLAYDVAALTAILAQAGNEPYFSASKLTMPNGFEGRDGIFRFLSSGVAQRGLAVLQVQPKSAKVISPAPRTFETVVN